MSAPTPPAAKHGTSTRYLHGPNQDGQPKGCRCDACRTANTRQTNRRRMAIETGRHRPMVDAQPVRDHVLALKEAGLPVQRVAQYDELWDADPAAAGLSPRASRQARESAAAHSWTTSLAWDDDLIDLPDAELAAELARRATAMSDAETQRCHAARYKDGDMSPLIVAGALEHARRRPGRRRTETSS